MIGERSRGLSVSQSPPFTVPAVGRSELQAEFSLTQMLDRPVSGRIFFGKHSAPIVGMLDHRSAG